MKLILVGLASSILLYTLPPAPAWADGERGTAAEAQRYSQREAETPQLDTFKGGCHGVEPWMILLIPLALVALPFYLLYEGCDALRKAICPEKPEPKKETAPPKKDLSRLLLEGVACA